MNGFVLCFALVALPVVVLYPVFGKIRRRGRTDRPDGLYTVYQPKKGEDVTFEIVAVHGLGAHPEYTWTGTPSASAGMDHGKRIHLLKDLLKDDFPTARILSFAHNSDWLIDAPITSAQQIGNRLLDDLVEHRNTRQQLLGNINQWTDGPIACEHVYWLQGKAGTGKSTIARTVAGELAEQGRLAASFFFKRNESDRGSARYVFSTIAAQLAQKLPAAAERMRNAIEANLGIAATALGEQFRKMILLPMEAVPYDAP
ncbi:vegetative incompatibility protein HET-E-1 [Penicillium nucicola]|uniref:vegetative incompatibility protein HET-E-1 n=1 Tax=Penicillium nucicola TaxID=1850975 RepID=UPI0025458EC7|nr:vegetative incompatibility protein HET-E-1 [Penicillium nucicola]KAJ5761778.1 vegetative incompatibility protein HET-E-1 [Penicillium nucicola]